MQFYTAFMWPQISPPYTVISINFLGYNMRFSTTVFYGKLNATIFLKHLKNLLFPLQALRQKVARNEDDLETPNLNLGMFEDLSYIAVLWKEIDSKW